MAVLLVVRITPPPSVLFDIGHAVAVVLVVEGREVVARALLVLVAEFVGLGLLRLQVRIAGGEVQRPLDHPKK